MIEISQVLLPVFYIPLAKLMLGRMRTSLMDGTWLSIQNCRHHLKLKILNTGLEPCLRMPQKSNWCYLPASFSITTGSQMMLKFVNGKLLSCSFFSKKSKLSCIISRVFLEIVSNIHFILKCLIVTLFWIPFWLQNTE